MPKFLIFILFILCTSTKNTTAQEINAAYVKSLYKRYPTQKSDFCASCKLWVNPYYKSIADTAKHTPLLTYYAYTKAHRLEKEALDLPRKVSMHHGTRQTDSQTKQNFTSMPIKFRLI